MLNYKVGNTHSPTWSVTSMSCMFLWSENEGDLIFKKWPEGYHWSCFFLLRGQLLIQTHERSEEDVDLPWGQSCPSTNSFWKMWLRCDLWFTEGFGFFFFFPPWFEVISLHTTISTISSNVIGYLPRYTFDKNMQSIQQQTIINCITLSKAKESQTCIFLICVSCQAEYYNYIIQLLF